MGFLREIKRHKGLMLMALPAVILLFLFNYMPMFGLTVAFKRFDYSLGIMGSPWVGFENFKLFAASKDTTIRIVLNTIGYWALFTATGIFCNVALAILLNECRAKWFAKISHTIMIFPTFVSWIAVTFIVSALLSTEQGMINEILKKFSVEPIQWYASPKYWPVILLMVNLWKNTGYGAIIYLSALAGMDTEIFEAAEIDGAGKWQQIKNITLPMLKPMVTIMLLLGLGTIMTSNTGLFYQVTKNIGLLYPTTQTIDAYVMNTLTNGSTDFGMTSAVTFLQSIVGFILVVVTNLIVRRLEPENALF